MLKKGKNGDEVKTLQENLQKLGYSVNADGDFGTVTDWAVKNFQAMFGYDVDGIVGPGTTNLIEQQIGYGWNITTPDAQKHALKAQGISVA